MKYLVISAASKLPVQCVMAALAIPKLHLWRLKIQRVK